MKSSQKLFLCRGFDTILEYSTFMWNNRHKTRSFQLVRYEDLHIDPAKELRRILNFVGAADVSDENVKKAGKKYCLSLSTL